MMSFVTRYELAHDLLRELGCALSTAQENSDLIDVEDAIANLMYDVKEYLSRIESDVREEYEREKRAAEREYQASV